MNIEVLTHINDMGLRNSHDNCRCLGVVINHLRIKGFFMSVASKFFLLLSLTVCIAGCKLAVIVVEGGEVQSINSGTCLEGTICVHQVNDTDYTETFTAVPNSGWAFVNWQSGDRFFCRGSIDPECDISAAGHEGNVILEAVIESDETFYLMPVFKQTSGYPPIVGGNKEWLQPADYVEYSPRQVEAICPPPSGVCSGSLPNSNVDLTGYHWASLADMAELLNGMMRYDPPISGSELEDPLPKDPSDTESILSVDQDLLFEHFRPTYTFFEGGPQRVLGAFSRDHALEPQHYEGIVIQYGIIGGGDPFINDADGSGAWFWRSLD